MELADVRRVVVADGGDLAGGADQVAQDGLALDDPAVVDGVDRRGRQVDERRQVGRAADLLQRVVAGQDLRDGDDVHRLAPLVQLEDGLVDGAVGLAVEVRRPQEVRHLDDRVAVDQQGAEHRLLGLDRLRREAVYGQGGSLHGGWTGCRWSARPGLPTTGLLTTCAHQFPERCGLCGWPGPRRASRRSTSASNHQSTRRMTPISFPWILTSS